MKKLITILLILLSTSVNAELNLRIVTEGNYHKQVNDNSAAEGLIKLSFKVHEDFTIKLGVSEGYTGFRAKPFNFNHAGTRVDIGAYWNIGNGFEIGYTHSSRKWFEGANPKDIFDYDSVDTLSIRKEFDIVF